MAGQKPDLIYGNAGFMHRKTALDRKRIPFSYAEVRMVGRTETFVKAKVAAVVVTFNRLPMLQKCMDMLENQTVPCDILVVDNASTDGTDEWLLSEQSAGVLVVRNTGANLGGAGGFSYGMRWAAERGYEYIWVMDDDCLPYPDALEKLLDAGEALNGDYGCLFCYTDKKISVFVKKKSAQ